MRQKSFADFNCSLAQSLELIGDWWTPLILRDLFVGLDRFDDLVEDLGISRNLLTTRLDHLVDGGLVERVKYSEHPPRDRYVLTQAARELAPIIAALTAWGDRWAKSKGGPPLLFRHRTCGHQMTPQVACSHCGEAIKPEDLMSIKGPGAKLGPGSRLFGRLVSRLEDGAVLDARRR